MHHIAGAFLSAADYVVALRIGETVQQRLERTLASVDVLATPVVPVITAEAARTGKSQPHTGGAAVFTAPFNLTGHPALAVPCGMSAAGIPIGLQLVGGLGGETDVLRLGHAYEQATLWHTMHPSLELAGPQIARRRHA